MKSSENPWKENDCDEDGRGGGIEDEQPLGRGSWTIDAGSDPYVGFSVAVVKF
jgi:hypothetical protein